MCSHDLPDMYALSPRACGPRALGIHIRQIPRAHVTTITYNPFMITHTGHYKVKEAGGSPGAVAPLVLLPLHRSVIF